jgi:hypothetical protein
LSNRSYWLDLFSGTSWQEFLNAGATVSGFNERRWKTVQRIKSGDYLLCYLTGVSRYSIQWLLLKLGSDMGLEVWVARNDRGREVSGNAFAKISALKARASTPVL